MNCGFNQQALCIILLPTTYNFKFEVEFEVVLAVLTDVCFSKHC